MTTSEIQPYSGEVPRVFTGRSIAEARKALGLSQTDLADKLTDLGYPYTRSQISRVERGTSEPTASIIGALADLLDTTVDAFYTQE